MRFNTALLFYFNIVDRSQLQSIIKDVHHKKKYTENLKHITIIKSRSDFFKQLIFSFRNYCFHFLLVSKFLVLAYITYYHDFIIKVVRGKII